MTSEKTAITSLVFDFGGVLLDYTQFNVLDRIFPSRQEAHAFVSKVNFTEFHYVCDVHGYWDTAELWQKKYPEYANVFTEFGKKWLDVFSGEVAGMDALLSDLEQKYTLYGLSNFCGDFFPAAYKKFKILHHFDDRIIISGAEKVRKPDPRIFQLMLDRFDLSPSHTLFIDDNPANIKAAQALGIPSLLFTGVADLKTDLQKIQKLPLLTYCRSNEQCNTI